MRTTFLMILLFTGCFLQAQFEEDSIKGNIKLIREKIIFLNDSVQNRKLFNIEGDYGHYGFSSPEFTISRFHEWWYHTYWVHYLNYERKYNEKGQLISEDWFDKKIP